MKIRMDSKRMGSPALGSSAGQRVVDKDATKPASAASGNGSSPRRPRYKKDALRIALCGIGRAGLGMARRELVGTPEVHVVAGFDLIEDRARQLAGMFGSKVHPSFKDVLADPNVELVVVATRSHEHATMAVAALRAGKHVLVEKPMALNLRETDRMLAAARRARGKLFVRHNRRFDPPFLQALEVVRSGKLGRIFSIQLRQGTFARRSDWQTLKKFGGGQLLNWGPHLIDWGLRLMDSKPADVWSDLKLVAAAGDAEDHVKLLIRGENGVIVDIEISGAAAIAQPQWVVLGSNGSLRIDGHSVRLRYFDPRRLHRVRANGATPKDYGNRHGEDIPWHEEEFHVGPRRMPRFWPELYRSLRRGTDFAVTLEQARQVMVIIELARRGTRF